MAGKKEGVAAETNFGSQLLLKIHLPKPPLYNKMGSDLFYDFISSVSIAGSRSLRGPCCETPPTNPPLRVLHHRIPNRNHQER